MSGLRRPLPDGPEQPRTIDPRAVTVAASLHAGRSHRRQVWLLTAGAVLLLLGSVVRLEWAERRQELDSATTLSQRRAALLAGDLSQALGLARLAIEQEEARLQALAAGTALRVPLQAAARERAQLLASLPVPFELHAIDSQGRALDLDVGSERPPAEAELRALAAPGADAARWQIGLTQGRPGARILPLLRRAAPNRHGVAAFAADFDHAGLVRRLAGERLPDGGGVALFRIEADGSVRVLARAPHVEAELGKQLRGPLAQAIERAPRGVFDALTQVDNTRRIVAYERLGGEASGLVIGYGVDTAAVLADWTRELPLIVLSTLLLAAGLLWGGWRLDRSLRSLEKGQQALQRSEDHFRALAGNLPDVVVRLDAQGRHLYANAAIEQATGRPPADFIGKTNADLGMPADHIAAWTAALARVFGHGRTERLEFAFLGPAGLRHWESLVAREPPAPGAAATALVISRDITERIERQAALRQVHATLGALVDSSTDAIFVKDPRGRYVMANRATAALLGRSVAELLGRDDHALFPADAADLFRADDQRLMQSRSTESYEESLPAAQGARRLLMTKGALLVDGALAGVFGIARDITERALALEQLRESEARHRELFEANPHPMWVYDLETLAFLAVNDAAVQQYGYGRDEFLRLTIKDIRPADDVAPLLDNLARHRVGLEEAGVWRHVRRDGRLLQVEITSHRLAFQGRRARLVLAHDVTRRLAAEQALRDSEERLRLALDAGNQGLYDVDLRTGMTLVSLEYARMLGNEPEDLQETQQAWRERVHPDDLAAVMRAQEEYLAGRTPDYRIEFRLRTRDGAWKWVLSLGKVQARDASGQPLRLLGTHTDITELRRIDAERRSALARFEQLFLAAPEAISLTELDGGRFLQVNDAFCDLFGHAREALLGRTALELGLWARPQDRADIVRRLRAGERVHGVDAGVRHRSGALIDGLFSAERVEFGGVDCLLLMFRDITERKRAEQALLHSELRFRLAASYGQVWEWDFGAGGLAPSAALFVLLGHPAPAPEAMAAAFEALLHPDDFLRMKQVLRRHLQHQGPYQLQFRAFDAQQRVRWFETQGQAVWDERGRATYMAGTNFEITARRQAEDEVRQLAAELEQRVRERTAELARSEARYRTIFDTVPVSIGEEDWSGVQVLLRELRDTGVGDGPAYFASHPGFVQRCLRAVKVLRLNRKGLSLHDAHDRDPGPRDLQAFYPTAADLPQFVGEIEALWQGRRQYTAKKSLPALSGRPLSLMMTMSLPALDDEDGTALVCLVDITEIDRLNAELDRSVARLRQVNQELETFTYSVSHDLKAPLRGIDGYSRLLLTDHAAQIDDEGRRFLGQIRGATQHMGALIDDLLAYSRMERRDVQLASLPLAPLVASVLAHCRQGAAAQAAELVIEMAPGLSARADAQGLTMALRNLVDNALKFSRDSQPPRVRVTCRRVEAGVQLTVTYNGLGFDMKYHDRLFSIFQRLHRAEDYPGTGVGLAIVRKAMERMGGRVWGQSQLGHGATFTLELPAADAAADAAADGTA